MRERKNSQKIYDQLCQVIPGGVNSPVRAFKAMQLSPPLVAAYGKEDQIFDVDGNGYIDYCGSWGALIHGHAHPFIVSAVQKRVLLGTSFGATTAIENQLARKIIELVKSVEKIRFVSSGTEATMSAARLARGYTKREMILKFGGNYHGHADFFLIQAGSGVIGLPRASSAGVPQEVVKSTISLPYNDMDRCREAFQKWGDQIAAVIIEPVAGNMGVVPAKREFLQMLREETKKAGALLILDEVITGFRVALGGAQQLYGIQPDLTCFGKIMGCGFPAAAFGGKAEIMDCLAPLGSVYQAGTLSGNPVAMEAGLQSLTLLQTEGFYEELARKTELLTAPIREEIQKRGLNCCLQQVGSMFTLFFGVKSVSNMEEAMKADVTLFAQFFRYLFENGVYISPAQHEACFVSIVHTQEHLIKTRDLILEFLRQL